MNKVFAEIRAGVIPHKMARINTLRDFSYFDQYDLNSIDDGAVS